MSEKAKDGAYIHLTEVTRVSCDRCSVVEITKYPTNDREKDDLIRKHMIKHGGRFR